VPPCDAIRNSRSETAPTHAASTRFRHQLLSASESYFFAPSFLAF